MHLFIYVDRFSPFLFHTQFLGHTIGIRWYGLSYALGFLFTFLYFGSAARRGAVPGLTRAVTEQMTVAIAVGVVLAGRLGFVAQHIPEFLRDPLFAVRVWEGGMAFFGGLVGALLAVLWVARKNGLPFLALTDVATLPAILSLAFGRFANFVNGELIGQPTGKPWGVVFPNVDYVPRYPSQLYEGASHFLLFAILIFVSRRDPHRFALGRGSLSFLFLTLYGFFRFLTDFYRADDTYWGPFSTGQWASLLLGIIGAVGLARVLRSLPARVNSDG